MDEESHRWQLTQAEAGWVEPSNKVQRLDAELEKLQKAGAFCQA
jgi:hypothetical protein